MEALHILRWSFDEYEQHTRSAGWYVIVGIVTAALLITAFVAKNFLFAVLIVMLAAVIALRHTQAPRRISVEITDRALVLDGRMLPFNDCEEFWIVEPERGRAVLYIDPKGIRPRIGIGIEGASVATIRAALTPHVHENPERDEPGGDLLGKILKL